MKKYIFLLIIFISRVIFSHENISIDELKKSQFRFKGPNCYSTTLYLKNITNSVSFVGSSFIYMLANSPYCEDVSAENRQKGDIVLARGFHYRFNGVGHAAFLTDKNQAISKFGYENFGEGKFIVHDELIKNPGGHISKPCHSTLTSSEKTDECANDLSAAFYIRCEVGPLKKFLTSTTFSKKIRSLRRSLHPFLTGVEDLTFNKKETFQKQLNIIRKEMINYLQTHYSSYNFFNHNNELSSFSFGARGNYSPDDVFISFPIELQKLSFDIMALKDLESQMSWLLPLN